MKLFGYNIEITKMINDDKQISGDEFVDIINDEILGTKWIARRNHNPSNIITGEFVHIVRFDFNQITFLSLHSTISRTIPKEAFLRLFKLVESK